MSHVDLQSTFDASPKMQWYYQHLRHTWHYGSLCWEPDYRHGVLLTWNTKHLCKSTFSDDQVKGTGLDTNHDSPSRINTSIKVWLPSFLICRLLHNVIARTIVSKANWPPHAIARSVIFIRFMALTWQVPPSEHVHWALRVPRVLTVKRLGKKKIKHTHQQLMSCYIRPEAEVLVPMAILGMSEKV